MQFLYAFSITPLKSMDTKELTQQPPAVTDCPYRDIMRAQVHSTLTVTCTKKNVTSLLPP